jgi:formylglycine-generating enzyme required for sulfatase activity
MPRLISFFLSSLVIFGMIQLDCQVLAQPPEEITNSIGMKLVLIPKGTFMMGSPESEEGRQKDETQHEVTISKDYYLGVTEVTQGQYEKVMGTNPSWFQKSRVQGSDNSRYPVDNVSWEDAIEFCKKLSDFEEEKKAGRVYRLPTEAEWEYACRAGSKTAFSFGESSNSLGDYAWFDGNSNGQTHPVGEKKANAWGLYDMNGNVEEWCSDWFGEYPKGAVSDPVGPREGSFRVIRGGGWDLEAPFCRSAYRRRLDPSLRRYYIGFRVALSPSGIPKSPEAGDEEANRTPGLQSIEFAFETDIVSLAGKVSTLGSGGLRTNGREVSPSGLKPNSRKTPTLARRVEPLGTMALHGWAFW